MNSKEFFILRRHAQKHIAELRIRPDFLRKRFAEGCAMAHCNGTCCKTGVLLDVGEKDKILRHADLVRKHMEPQQEKDSDLWFGEVEEDNDFPSGQCVPTRVESYGCVFLNGSGRCVLQKAAMTEGLPKFALKPFFCVSYPVTIEDGEVITDDPDFTYRTECCSTVRNGSLTVTDVCAEELEFMLGREGFEEVKQLTKEELRNG